MNLNKSSLKFTCALIVVMGRLGLLSAAPIPVVGPYNPVISPNGGYYHGGLSVAMSCPGTTLPVAGSTPVVWYALNGALLNPATGQGTPYTPGQLINVNTSETIQAVAYDGTNTSSVTTAIFNIDTSDPVTPSLPVITPNGGNYTGSTTAITIAPMNGYTILYTVDGSTPIMGGGTTLTYPGTPVTPSNPFTVVRARAVKTNNTSLVSGVTTSAPFSFGNTATCPTPTISQNGGAIAPGTNTITLSLTQTNPPFYPTIYYTTDSTTPDSTSTQLPLTAFTTANNGAITATKFIGSAQTFKYYVSAPGMADSPAQSAAFTLSGQSNPIPVTLAAGQTNDSANWTTLNNALTSAVNSQGSYKSTTITITTPGTYYFSKVLKPSGCGNLTIDGQGSTFICENANGAFDVSNCPNFTLQNFIIDSASPLNSPGTAVDFDVNGTYVDFLLDPGFTAANMLTLGDGTNPATGTLDKILQYDPVQRATEPYGLDQTAPSSPGYLNLQMLGTNKVRVLGTNNLMGGGALAAGDYVNLRQYVYDHLAVNFKGCDVVNVKNVTIFASSSMGLTAGTSSDITLTNFDLLAEPGTGRLSSASADGTHFTTCRGLVNLVSSSVQSQGDDGLNVQGVYYTITNEAGNTITITNTQSPSNTPNIAAGEQIEFRSGAAATFLEQYGTTAYVTAATTSGSNEILTLSITPPAEQSTSDVVDSLSTVARLSANRCNFFGNRARGMVLSSKNMLIQHCRFSNITTAAIQLNTSAGTYLDSTAINNAQIIDNSIEHCNYGSGGANGAIEVLVSGGSKTSVSKGVNTNIVIADNDIHDVDNSAISIGSADSVDVLGNNVCNGSILATSGTPNADGIYAYTSSNVRVNNNTQNLNSSNNYLRYAYDQTLPYIYPDYSTGTPPGYNVQPFVIGFSQTNSSKAVFNTSWNVQSQLPTGQSVFTHLCNSTGGIVQNLGSGGIGDPSLWTNGGRQVSPNQTSINLSTLTPGTYTLRLGIYSGSTRLQLLGDDDGSKRIIAGTLTITGTGGSTTATFASQQVDITPSVSQFVQTSPNNFNIAFTWNIFDNSVPAGATASAYILDASGNHVALPISIPTTWTPGTQFVTTTSAVNLAGTTIIPGSPTANNYSVYVSLSNGGVQIPLSGHAISGQTGVQVGILSDGTGQRAPIGQDVSGTITENNNPNF